jgi:phenylpropionate dioxygenase-like ring-hydroxylating dioxygenase large terminal subunit
MATIGRQPVIVNRDRKGNFNVLVNRCRHRGASVCEVPKGKANGFTCPYHSWSYSLEGQLRGVPYPEGYEGVVEKKDMPLQRLRVESYAGMIFASFNQDIEPLEDFLGDAKIWIDRFMKQGAGYPIKVQGEHRFRFDGNWKIQLENTTDGYHFPIVHRSWMASVDAETADMLSFMTDEKAVTHALGNGHSVAIMVPEHVDLEEDDGTEDLQERFGHIIEELSQTMPAEQVRRIVRSMHGAGFNLNLFPNVAMSMSFFRVLRPISVNETEIQHMALGLEGGPESVNRERLRIHEHFQGPFGFGTPDDSEAWDRVQRGAYGNKEMPILVNRGLGREEITEEGWKTSHVTDESGMREAYAQWKKMMSND